MDHGPSHRNSLYWNDEKNEWRSIVELSVGGVTAPETLAARQTVSPKKNFLRTIGGASKKETPVRYWVWRIGSVGLLIGFLDGLSAFRSIGQASIAFSIGNSIPFFLLFAAVGGIVGLIAKRNTKAQQDGLKVLRIEPLITK